MKRSFSLSELQDAIDAASSPMSSPMAAVHQDTSTFNAHNRPYPSGLASMRRSKSMEQLNQQHAGFFDMVGMGRAESGVVLPSLASLGLSLPAQQHGYEELKRGRGLNGKLPTSSSNSSLSNMVAGNGTDVYGATSQGSPVPAAHGHEGGSDHQDDETRGAASALIELFSQQGPNTSGRHAAADGSAKRSLDASFPPPVVLPPLRDLLASASHVGQPAVPPNNDPSQHRTSGQHEIAKPPPSVEQSAHAAPSFVKMEEAPCTPPPPSTHNQQQQSASSSPAPAPASPAHA
eukprot:CAMPEP_0181324238 /NCGR_PEP_ID=MMETSP1101-20121128/20244_1 /TAXON_ID=46948 /ORGANISM="Rhodomonas abbreviata, Strain Caron Lab Isolate" /LENGTH=289 /DNA_ID=CAMNT_0023432383 /DNA_START=136 /DNA_END=1002 /DNA_ORIENTATION=+